MENRITINQAINEFPNYLYIKSTASSTIKAYTSDIKIFQRYLKTNFPSIVYIDTIKKIHIISYRNFLCDKLKNQEYKKATVDRKYDSLKVFYDFLEYYELIDKNFVKDFKFTRARHMDFDGSETMNLPRFLEDYEIKKIIYTAKTDRTENRIRDIAILELLRATGCRRSSVLALTWEDINFDKNTILIKHQKTKNFSTIPLSPTLKQALIDHKLVTKGFTGNVFNIKKDAFNDLINKYVSKSGLQEQKDFKITAHTFRHSFITLLVKKDVPLEKIAQYTGHKDIRSLRVYTHLIPKDLDDIAMLIG
ncbi:tyrosine-type recombinase/integrase [Brassicibacter mesophilus]|uniref:tyrosine-type recombinase/integrase n=1 Tax=Brassicibacter mesophilus TaxID=745119 RepID=UPI003D249EEA